jgi:hypothetical protein
MQAEDRHHSTLIIIAIAIVLGAVTFLVVSSWDTTDQPLNADHIHQGQRQN